MPFCVDFFKTAVDALTTLITAAMTLVASLVHPVPDQPHVTSSQPAIFQISYIAEQSATCESLSASGSLSTAHLGASDFAIGRDIVGASCCGTAQRSESIEPIIGDDTAFVEIELV